MKKSLLAILLTLSACGGGESEVVVRTQKDATDLDLAKCGVGAYWVPPAGGATGKGTCYLFAVLPAASAP